MTEICSSLRRMMRLSAIVLAVIVLNASAASAQLGSAQTFAVLGASTVTNVPDAGTVVTGDLGVSPGSAVTGFPPGIVTGTIYVGGTVEADAAHRDALLAYAGLAAMTCPAGNNLTALGDLGGLTLPSGVYCFDSSAGLTGTLNLTGDGPWIFQIGSTLTTASGSLVLVNGGAPDCDVNDVFWQVGSSATLGTGTQFVGNILALASITLTNGANVSGSALALTGAVTMDTNLVSVCNSGGAPFPPQGAIKVTGGGQIPVPDPDNAAPNASGTGRATFGFNAQSDNSGGSKGHFNYLNHVTGLHVNGPVTDIVVIATNPEDGSPKTVLFSGLCNGVPSCSFIVTVEDNDEPGTIDEFGITIIGDVSEVRSQRVISRGNIQFHKE